MAHLHQGVRGGMAWARGSPPSVLQLVDVPLVHEGPSQYWLIKLQGLRSASVLNHSLSSTGF